MSKYIFLKNMSKNVQNIFKNIFFFKKFKKQKKEKSQKKENNVKKVQNFEKIKILKTFF